MNTFNEVLDIDERRKKTELLESINADGEELARLNEIMLTIEVDASYMKTIWPKGLVLLYALQKNGYKIIKDQNAP